MKESFSKLWNGTIGSEIKRGYDNSHPAFRAITIVATAPTVGVLTIAGGSAILGNTTTRNIAEGLYGAPATNPARLIGRGIRRGLEDLL